MEKTNINLNNIWQTQARQISDNIILRYKISQLERLDCYIGTICSLGKKLFIMKLEADDHPCNFENRFAGVDIYISQNKDNKELYILLQDDKLSEIFVYFVEDIINYLANIYDNTTALKIIKERVNFWRLLFSKISRDILSAEQQRGLFGELYFLERLLNETKDKYAVINAWHGPLALNQDFRFNNLALEIKATKKNNPTIKISNEYQLDRSGLD
ncbi:MAG: PD-(D/E)XK motif protein, partial [Tannerellaceae bacterium]